MKTLTAWKNEYADYYFDEPSANRVCRFFEKHLHHQMGDKAGHSFRLERWQRKILRRFFGWRHRATNLRKYRVLYLEIPRKNGKALAIETPIPTPTGWKNHGDLKVGDYVFGKDGKPKKVTGVTPHYLGKCFALEIADGETIITHECHEWETNRTWFTKRKRGPAPKGKIGLPLVETKEIAATLQMTGIRQDYVHSITVPAALECQEQILPIAPYTFGAWLGDGTARSGDITTTDKEIIQAIKKDGFPMRKLKAKYRYSLSSGRYSSSHSNKSIKEILRSLNVILNKHIPINYLRASITQRLDLLAGLIDTDGHVTKKGQCEIVLTNYKLAKDVQNLIRTLGYKATISESEARINGRYISQRWRISFFPNRDLPLRINRKKERLIDHKSSRSKTRMIVGCNPCGERLVNCIEVEGGFYLAGESYTPTHNSILAAGLSLYLLDADGEPGARVACFAKNKDQADESIFQVARGMVESSPVLSKRITVFHRSMVVYETGSNFLLLTGARKGKHGKNLSALIGDEVHEWDDRQVMDSLRTSMIGRAQPVEIYLTTAGNDKKSVWWEFREYTQRIKEGTIVDPSFLGIIYAADRNDDWTKRETWAKANPNLGVSIREDVLAAECDKAKRIPAYETSFRQLHLNLETSGDSRWITSVSWDDCGEEYTLETLKGRPAYLGVDLGAVSDLAAVVAVIPYDDVKYRIWPIFFCPEDTIIKRTLTDRVPYETWARLGLLIPTPGNVCDYDYIEQEINRLNEVLEIKGIALDRWNAIQLATSLQKNYGEKVSFFSQTLMAMAPPMRELEELIIAKKIRHPRNAILDWMIGNTSVITDSNKNKKPAKDRSKEKIDGVTALVNAMGRAMQPTQDTTSVYEERGFLAL